MIYKEYVKVEKIRGANMKTESQENEKKPVLGLSRRGWIRVCLIFILGGALPFQIIRRRIEDDDQLLEEGIPIFSCAVVDGHFSEYKFFRPNELDLQDCQKKLKSIQIQGIEFDQHNDYDNMGINFAFIGKKDPRKRFAVTVTSFDGSGNAIGSESRTFRDYRWLIDNPPKVGFGMWEDYPIPDTGDVFITLQQGKRMKDVRRIQIDVKNFLEIKDSSGDDSE